MYFLFNRIWKDIYKKKKEELRKTLDSKQHDKLDFRVVFNLFFLLEHTSGDDNDPRLKGRNCGFLEELKRERERGGGGGERQRERERERGGARKKEIEKESKSQRGTRRDRKYSAREVKKTLMIPTFASEENYRPHEVFNLCVHVYERERERERQTDRQTDRQTNRDRETETETETETDRQTDRQKDLAW